MIIFIKVICIVLAIVIIGLVLLQQGKGSDLGSAFGGGSSNSMFGALGPSNFLGKFTYILVTVWLILSLLLAYLYKTENSEVIFDTPLIEEATVLTKFASTVHWITSSDPKSDNEEAMELMDNSNIKHWSRTRLLEILGDDMGVNGVVVKNKQEENPINLNLDGVFVYMSGSKPITDFLGDQIALKEDGGVIVDDFMSTNSDGVWAIGDIRNTPFKQAVVAASDGCIAAMSIDRYLNSRKNIRVDWIHS